MKDFYGPWTFELSTHEVHDKDGDLIVDVDSGDFLKEKSADLGLLIAAAPEMFELLAWLVDIEGPQPGNSEWASRVNAVIAKALGEPK